MFFCDHGYDSAENTGARLYDPTRRAMQYKKAGDKLIAQVPILPLGFERRAYLVSRTLADFSPNELGRDYWNAWEFSRLRG